jgi:hypothetical protein
VDVTNDDGSIATWGFEAEGPSTLMRAGVRLSDLPPGGDTGRRVSSPAQRRRLGAPTNRSPFRRLLQRLELRESSPDLRDMQVRPMFECGQVVLARIAGMSGQ